MAVDFFRDEYIKSFEFLLQKELELRRIDRGMLGVFQPVSDLIPGGGLTRHGFCHCGFRQCRLRILEPRSRNRHQQTAVRLL